LLEPCQPFVEFGSLVDFERKMIEPGTERIERPATIPALLL
jgi:hypothetical protein